MKGGLALAALFLVVQVFYPTDRLPLFATIDGVNVSAWKQQDATWQLDNELANQAINIRLGDAKTAYTSVKPSEIGLKAENKSRVATADYPWYMRIIPTSLLWYGPLQSDQAPQYTSDAAVAKRFVNKTLGTSCNIPAKNASLAYKDNTLQVVPAKNGGSCEEAAAVKALQQAKPTLEQIASVRIPVKTEKAAVSDQAAESLRDDLLGESKNGVNLIVASKTKQLSQADVLSWLTFKADGDTLTYVVDSKKAASYFAKNVTPGISKPAGITKITTRDFTETSKSVGATGQTLALTSTLADIEKVLDGDQEAATAFTTKLPPRVEYTRSYTKTSTGIAALLKFYDEDTPGSFGVSFVELGGRGLAASHNASTRFTTASTYKLFVAYGTLRKVDAGKWKWTDANIASGRNLATCFDDMIVKSDNACAEAPLKKYGLSQLTKDIAALGLNNSGFTLGDTPLTTAGDLTLLLTKLQNNQLPIKSASRDRWLGALKRNIYRQGIPAGASGQVADKVGFLNGLLHDAAIVYSPKGTYVLTILTDGSSWANIAELTRKIEALR